MLAKDRAEVDTRAVRREANRARILDAAWRLARRNGLAAITMRELGSEVGMRAPSLYRYFDSKHALYDAMFAESVRLLGEAVDGPTKSSDPHVALRQRMQRFFRFFTQDPVRFQLVDQRPIPGFEPSAESYAISVRNIERVRKDLQAAGVKGERGVDLWRAMVTGVVNQQISNDPGGSRWTRLGDEVLEMFLARYAKHNRRAKGGTRG